MPDALGLDAEKPRRRQFAPFGHHAPGAAGVTNALMQHMTAPANAHAATTAAKIGRDAIWRLVRESEEPLRPTFFARTRRERGLKGDQLRQPPVDATAGNRRRQKLLTPC